MSFSLQLSESFANKSVALWFGEAFGSLLCCNVWCVIAPGHYNDRCWGPRHIKVCVSVQGWSALRGGHLQDYCHLAEHHLESVIHNYQKTHEIIVALNVYTERL